MAGQHHWLNGHESEQTPRDSEGQGSLVCCSPWGCKKQDMTYHLKNNNNIHIHTYFPHLANCKIFITWFLRPFWPIVNNDRYTFNFIPSPLPFFFYYSSNVFFPSLHLLILLTWLHFPHFLFFCHLEAFYCAFSISFLILTIMINFMCRHFSSTILNT